VSLKVGANLESSPVTIILQIFDVILVWSADNYPTLDGVSFVVRAETDIQVVTFKGDWVRTGPFPSSDTWLLNRVTNVVVAAKC
jgi:hypothetical protein